MGSEVYCRSSLASGRISCGPSEQLKPMRSAPSPSITAAIEGTQQPVKVRPVASKVMLTISGSGLSRASQLSLTARMPALTSYRSVIVSSTTRSTPAVMPARTCSQNSS